MGYQMWRTIFSKPTLLQCNEQFSVVVRKETKDTTLLDWTGFQIQTTNEEILHVLSDTLSVIATVVDWVRCVQPCVRSCFLPLGVP